MHRQFLAAEDETDDCWFDYYCLLLLLRHLCTSFSVCFYFSWSFYSIHLFLGKKRGGTFPSIGSICLSVYRCGGSPKSRSVPVQVFWRGIGDEDGWMDWMVDMFFCWKHWTNWTSWYHPTRVLPEDRPKEQKRTPFYLCIWKIVKQIPYKWI